MSTLLVQYETPRLLRLDPPDLPDPPPIVLLILLATARPPPAIGFDPPELDFFEGDFFFLPMFSPV